MAEKKKILAGHKQVGEKFIPPMMQIPNMEEISYVHQILPEIIWIGLLNDKVGYKRGIHIVSRISEIAYEIKDTELHTNFAFASNFNTLSAQKKTILKARLSDETLLDVVQEALLPLTKLYRHYPMVFFKTKTSIKKRVLVERMRECVDNHFDKYETPSLAAQSLVAYTRGITGGLHLASHIKAPNLNAIIEKPESEEAKHAAGFVRIQAMMECMPMRQSRSDDWATSFWNQSYKLDRCDFSWEETDG